MEIIPGAMFSYVNEVAVIAASFFMVAVAMLWYSEYLFQKQWMRAVGFTREDMEAATPHLQRNFILSFISYVVTNFLIALALGVAQVLDVSVRAVAGGLVVGFASLLAGFVVWEQRSLMYYAITVGFGAVFILGSSFILYYWPW